MGCSASQPETLLSSSNTIDPSSSSSSAKPQTPNSVHRTVSLPTHIVHHLPLKKGDTHHLVSLTSTTYGSLLHIDDDFNHYLNPNPNPNSNPKIQSFSSSSSPSNDPPSPDSVINTWELMAGLDEDFDAAPKPFSQFFDDRRCFSFDSKGVKSKKSSLDSYQSMKFTGIAEWEVVPPLENATKPLWQHLSEELILADMDPNVVSSFRRAESSRKLGFNKKMKSSVSEANVSPLVDYKIQLPGTEDRIVIYFTSLRGIRRTHEDCNIVRSIFKGLRVPLDERDISMDSAYRKELQNALDKISVSLPQVFVRGRCLGGVDEVKQLHEDGELVKFVEGFPVQDPGIVPCLNCGDARFVPCLNCNGSRKVFDEEEGHLSRCADCNENGLIRCPSCCS